MALIHIPKTLVNFHQKKLLPLSHCFIMNFLEKILSFGEMEVKISSNDEIYQQAVFTMKLPVIFYLHCFQVITLCGLILVWEML